MQKESDIFYEKGDYYAIHCSIGKSGKMGIEVRKNGITHSVVVATIGYPGEKGISKAIELCDRFATTKH